MDNGQLTIYGIIQTRKLNFFIALCVLHFAFCICVSAQSLPVAAPQTAGMSAEKLNQIDALVEKDIADKKYPGAVVVIGHKGKIVYRKAFGNRALVPTVEKMTIDTIFDAASLTKPVATATSVMILVEQGKIRLTDTIGKFIPEIQDKDAKNVTVLQLLTHVSGYAPDFDLREKWMGHDGMIEALKKEKLRTPPGTKFVYSDIGFIVLGEIVQRVSDQRLAEFSHNVFINITKSGKTYFNNFAVELKDFRPPNESLTAPTENIQGQQNYLGGSFRGSETEGSKILRGFVHDPTAYRMGGVAGHAGLFTTADDLARYCQMLLNGGVLDGKRILSAQTVARMTAPYVISEAGQTRGLGWDINTSFSGNRGEFFPLGSFGHTGFTGTSVWIDPTTQTFVVIMSNRVHPDGKGDAGPIRARVATLAAAAVLDTPIEKIKEAESEYSAQVAAQMPRFMETVRQAANRENRVSSVPDAKVLNGVDVLEKNNFKDLNNLRVGLVTNQTGRNLTGTPTIDVLKNAANVKLLALFSPEHGIRGELDEEGIKDSKDEKTGLPIYSLYNDQRRPKPEQLKNLDALVYDIQDIGARFYTYTATLRNVLEEAAKAKIPVYVLDRPNPINGVTVEGSLADEDKLNFIAAHTIPVRYGLTIGELGMMMNTERKIGADLRVIKMENWSRQMYFDQTNQMWINPSPNMRSLTEATLYPGIGLLETTNVSVGRGTDTPFEVVGAPYIDGQVLAKTLNDRKISGVRFVPIRFKPNTSVFKNENLNGINIIITDRNSFNSVRAGMEIAAALRKLYPSDWQVDKYSRLLVNQEILEKVKNNESANSIENSWQASLNEFMKRREKFLLYK
jgi:uncharacterized protein YbbC (DUF1343 family)/CubicO group peptidase (beta-lactamase class C family)